ncbi:MAG TPA: DNA polymerase III subunit chi [Rhodospirillales bacterium]|nr:DNA polymerase III subunit chi [Rhodospirillales bacterium]
MTAGRCVLQVGFYHLTRSRLEEALPRLLEKVLEAGQRAVVRVADGEQLELLNRALWTYRRESFLPHGTRADGFAERQPIYLTAGLENPNGARVLVLVGGASTEGMADYARCLDLFDGNDPEAVAAARARWRAAREAGHELVYWQQKEGGGWQRAR